MLIKEVRNRILYEKVAWSDVFYFSPKLSRWKVMWVAFFDEAMIPNNKLLQTVMIWQNYLLKHWFLSSLWKILLKCYQRTSSPFHGSSLLQWLWHLSFGQYACLLSKFCGNGFANKMISMFHPGYQTLQDHINLLGIGWASKFTLQNCHHVTSKGFALSSWLQILYGYCRVHAWLGKNSYMGM